MRHASLNVCVVRHAIRRRALHSRRGFALLTVLWVLAGVAGLSLASNLAARDTVATARNRIALLRAGWRAEDCAERALAVIGEALIAEAAGGAAHTRGAWRDLDRVMDNPALVPAYATSHILSAVGCTIDLRPAGAAVDINSADGSQLRRLFVSLGISAERADSLADALLDWRDGDDVPREFGAERAWYEERGRRLPRDGELFHMEELRRVRGFAELGPALDSAITAAVTVEPGRLCLMHAVPAALASLPGMTVEAVARTIALRDEVRRASETGTPLGAAGAISVDLLMVSGSLSPMARESLAIHYADLAGSVVTEPDAWILTARGASSEGGTPTMTSLLELRLVRAGARAAVVRRRTGL